MPLNNIYLYISDAFEDRQIGYIVGFKLQILKKNKNNFYEIVLNNLILEEDINVKEHSILNFKLSRQNHFLFSIYNLENICITKENYDKKVVIKANLESYIKRYSVNFYLNLLDSWEQEKYFYHWSNLALFQKRLWLDACMYWNGINTKINNSNKVIMFECKNVRIKEDLYCYLGELFFGYSGYIGKNLDGLDDCLSQIENKELYILKLRNFTFLENTLDNYGKQRNYTKILIDIFRDNKMKIELD